MNAKAEFEGIEVEIYRSPIDNKIVIQVDTDSESDIAVNGQPICRVYMNEGRVWEGLACGEEVYGNPD